MEGYPVLKKSDFYYDLPHELIAQHPLPQRDHSRLMSLNRETGEIGHYHFYDIENLLRPGDLLVVNNSRVIPARIYGFKKDTGSHVEFLLLEQKAEDTWEILVKPGKKAKMGVKYTFGDGLLEAEVVDIFEDGNRLVRFTHDPNKTIYSILDEIGQMPLPPYITQKLEDKERYQTVYSKDLGSAAAPTAGLHFTKELLAKLAEKGVELAYVTLHVGLGTFRPVKVDDVTQHKMHSEHYFLPQETVDKIAAAKARGGRVIAVGTTSCRTLEAVGSQGPLRACEGYTDIFIYPGYQFQVLDGLITNFHLPESTLIMLVSALAGKENILHAYQVAVEERYRFFSFGDAMFIH